ncbi:MAG: 2-oxoacid:acceptor oxidoreductase family protein [Ruminococcus sp.]|nr:2-oxoacid:acceptor oxidoreductase family protein [Ruminococcus sp.]
MTEILWHGRGGQGAFTAARLLGAAFALKGNESYALAFPSFGPERRGAPIRAFTKLDQRSIGDRSEIEKADFSIFLDDTLFSEKSFEELKPNGKILLNTKQSVLSERVISIDADELAIEILKLPITNTIMLSAFAAVSADVSLENIEKAIYQNMSEKLQRKNILAVRAAAEAIRRENDR